MKRLDKRTNTQLASAMVASLGLLSPAYGQLSAEALETKAEEAPSTNTAIETSPAEVNTESQKSEAESFAVEEIVVTAQRRAQKLEEVPISVASVGAADLESFNLTSTDDLKLVSPGLVFDRALGYAQAYIRGIGTNLPNPGLEGAVATYIDGAYLERNIGTVSDMFDIAQAQVLKGAQGTLYGRNATGGAILLTTADPTNQRSLSLAQEYGRFNHQLTEAIFNTPISDSVSIRIGGRVSSQDGYLTNVLDGQKFGARDAQIARAKIRWDVNERLSAILGIEYSELTDSSNAQAERKDSPNCAGCAIPGSGTPVSGFYDVATDSTTPTSTLSKNANLRLKYQAEGWSVDSVTAYRDDDVAVTNDVDFTGANLFNFKVNTGGKMFSQEVQLATDAEGPLNALAGASYLHDDGYYDADISGGAFGPLNPKNQSSVVTQSYSVFVEGYYSPVDRLKATVGGRYTRDHRSLDSNRNADAELAQFAPAGSPGSFDSSATFNSFTPRVVLAYDFSAVNTYLSWNRGFKAGGYSTPAFAPQPEVKPEKIDSFELGGKFVSDDRRLRLNVASFLYLYRDIQVPVVDLTAGGLATQNAGRARGYGLEADGMYSVTSWLDFIGSAAWLHARYTSYPNAQVNNEGPTGLSTEFEDLKGQPLSRAPNVTASLGAQAHTRLGDNWIGNASVIGRYTSEYDFYPGRGGNLRYDFHPDYTLINLTASVGPASGNYTVGAYIDNLTNQRYYAQRWTAAPFGVADQVGMPINFGLRFTANFSD